MRVVWVCGAPAAGKSVAAWSLFEELAGAGRGVAYVDIDQLGMLYPAVEEDPERHGLKAVALAALVPGYAAAGARTLVVSGVVDVRVGPRTAMPPDVDLTMVLLSPDSDVLRQRIRARGRLEGDADTAVEVGALLRNAPFVDDAIDTTGLSVADTVARLRELVGGSGPSLDARSRVVPSGAGTEVVVVTGPRAAGSSTVGFGLARRRWGAGRRTAFVDMQQLGFCSGRDGLVRSDPTLAIGQLAVMHELVASRGAGLLVVGGHLGVLDRSVLRTALPAARVTVVRLRADRVSFESHVQARARGSEARLAGDDLLDSEPGHQRRVTAAALAEQDILERSALDDAVLDVSDRTPTEVIEELEIVCSG